MKVVKKIPANSDEPIEEFDPAIEMELAEMQKYVGGYIERAKANVFRHLIVVNEDGVAQQLPFNRRATALLHYRYSGSCLYGNALLVKG